MSTMKKKGLGRGLEALLGSPAEIVEAAKQEGAPTVLKLEQMQPGKYQPRTRMDEGALQELAASIRAQGLMQPILVRKVESDGAKPKYEIIAGERRFRASRLAGLTEVPVLVKDVPDESAAAMALIENIQREDLNPMESAAAYQRLVDEFQLKQDDIAVQVGKDRATVANYLRLLKLPEEVRGNVASGALSMGHARAIVALPSEADQKRLAREVVSRGLSVRETEALVKKEIGTKPGESKAEPVKPKKDVHTRAAEDQLRMSLGTPVEIKRKGKGGMITIAFTNETELQRLYEYLTEKK